MKAELIDEITGEYAIFCEGCRSHHSMTTLAKNSKGAQWSFNGDLEKPTFKPSIVVTYTPTPKNIPKFVCHSFITDGKIRYLTDSYHKLKGKTVDLLDLDKLEEE